MNGPKFFSALVALVVALSFAHPSHSQVVGISAILSSTNGNEIDAYSATEIQDSNTAYYYDADVVGGIFRDGNLITSQEGYGNPVAEAYPTTQNVNFGSRYTLASDHYLITYFTYGSYYYNPSYYSFGSSFSPGGGAGDPTGTGYGPGGGDYYITEDDIYLGTTAIDFTPAAPQVNIISPNSDEPGSSGTLHVQGAHMQDDFGVLSATFLDNSVSVSVLNAGASSATLGYTVSPTAATGTHQLVLSNTWGPSEPVSFTVRPPVQTYVPPADPCAVASSGSSQLGYTSVGPTGIPGGSGTLSVSFSGAAFSAVAVTVPYGPSSTPESIAASIAAIVSKNYYRYGLSAKAYGSSVVYSGNTDIGIVTNAATGPSFTTTNSSAAAAQAENACHTTPSTSTYAVSYSAYIPVDHVSGPDFCYTTPSLGVPFRLIYHGDGLHNSYRVTQALNLNFAASQSSGYFHDTGLTQNYGYLSPSNGHDLSSADDDAVFLDERTQQGTADCYLRNAVGKASQNGWLVSSAVSPSSASVGMSGTAQDPLSYPLGSVKWDINTFIDNTSRVGYVTFTHTCYPSHQVRAANTTLYLYTPPHNDLAYIGECLTGIRSQVTGTSSTKTIR